MCFCGGETKRGLCSWGRVREPYSHASAWTQWSEAAVWGAGGGMSSERGHVTLSLHYLKHPHSTLSLEPCSVSALTFPQGQGILFPHLPTLFSF